MIYDVITIGAGASGLFAMANLNPDLNAICLEKNTSAGKKLLLTGGGKCNLTAAEGIKQMVAKYEPTSFVRPILYKFNNLELIRWFEARGLRCVQQGMKIFPESGGAKAVLNVLLENIEQSGHKIVYHTEVQSIASLDDGTIEISVVQGVNSKEIDIYSHNKSFKCKNLIIATGGKSFPKTGSDGKFLENNFEIVEFEPALTPIYIKELYFNELSGVDVKGVNIISFNKKRYFGDLLFAGKFLTGPAILNFSAGIRVNSTHSGFFYIDFLPDLNSDRLLELLAPQSKDKRLFKNYVLEQINLPDRLLESLLQKSGVLNTRVSEISKKNLHELVNDLKNLKLSILDKGDYNVAMSSIGGMDSDCIDSKTMCLKSDSRIKFIGEALDISAQSGGYSLQFAFSSAFLAVRTGFI